MIGILAFWFQDVKAMPKEALLLMLVQQTGEADG